MAGYYTRYDQDNYLRRVFKPGVFRPRLRLPTGPDGQHTAVRPVPRAPVVDGAAALARAELLLSSALTSEQQGTRREHGYFDVSGSAGGRWRIWNNGQSGNVQDLASGMGYCAHPPDYMPVPDAHLAQMLALVTDEAEFRKVAYPHVFAWFPTVPAEHEYRLALVNLSTFIK